jgi:hypothetical protein
MKLNHEEMIEETYFSAELQRSNRAGHPEEPWQTLADEMHEMEQLLNSATT